MFENTSEHHFSDLFDINEGISNIPWYIFLYIFIFGFCAIIGTFGNILVIIVTLINKHLRNERNAFIVSLAVGDLMVCAVTMPASITGVIMGRQWFDERPILCAFTSTMCAPGCLVSMLSISWIAVSRYYYIIEFSSYLRYFTTCRMVLYISSIWIISFGAHIPNHFGWGQTRYSLLLRFCSIDSEMYSYALFYCGILLSAICVSFVFYCRIYLALRKSTLSKSLIVGKRNNLRRDKEDISKGLLTEKRNRRTDKETNAKMEELLLIKTSFKIFMLCFSTWIPFTILVVISFIEFKFPPWVYLYAGLLAHCNSTLNFFVYFIENQTFRSAMKKLVIFRNRRIDNFNGRLTRLVGNPTPDMSQRIIQSSCYGTSLL